MAAKTATLYRMVTDQHICPFGLKARDLLQRQGFAVTTICCGRAPRQDAFKAEHDVKTTPQVFIDGARIGGYDDLRRHFGKPVADPKAVTYRPVDRRLRHDGPDGARGELCRVRHALHDPGGRVVHRLLDVRAGDPEAAGHRELLEHVPRLRPAGPALGPLRQDLSLRGGAGRHPHGGRRPHVGVGPGRARHRRRSGRSRCSRRSTSTGAS